MPTNRSTGSDESEPQSTSVFRRLLRAFEPGIVAHTAGGVESRQKRDAKIVVPAVTMRLDAGVAKTGLISPVGTTVRHRPVWNGSLPTPAAVALCPERPRAISALNKSAATGGAALRARCADLTVVSPPTVSAHAALAVAQPGAVSEGIETYNAQLSCCVTGFLLEAQCRTKANAALSISKPRVRVAPEAGRTSMLLARRKERALNDISFLVEQRALAAAAGIPMTEIHWIGLYRLVPLAATQTLKVDEERGQLTILLKADAVETLKRSRRCVVSLAIGRNKQTGAIVQALIS
jgi:hypothetical protein